MTDFDPTDGENTLPLPALSTLMTRFVAIVTEHGLQSERFAVMPSFNPKGPHTVQTVILLDPDWNPDEQPTSDPEFDKIIADAEKAEKEQQATEARESLERLRDGLADPGKGIGLDG